MRSCQSRLLSRATLANAVDVDAGAEQAKIELRARNLGAKIPLPLPLGRGHSAAPVGPISVSGSVVTSTIPLLPFIASTINASPAKSTSHASRSDWP
jgi:hypothetical protein